MKYPDWVKAPRTRPDVRKKIWSLVAGEYGNTEIRRRLEEKMDQPPHLRTIKKVREELRCAPEHVYCDLPGVIEYCRRRGWPAEAASVTYRQSLAGRNGDTEPSLFEGEPQRHQTVGRILKDAGLSGSGSRRRGGRSGGDVERGAERVRDLPGKGDADHYKHLFDESLLHHATELPTYDIERTSIALLPASDLSEINVVVACVPTKPEAAVYVVEARTLSDANFGVNIDGVSTLADWWKEKGTGQPSAGAVATEHISADALRRAGLESAARMLETTEAMMKNARALVAASEGSARNRWVQTVEDSGSARELGIAIPDGAPRVLEEELVRRNIFAARVQWDRRERHQTCRDSSYLRLKALLSQGGIKFAEKCEELMSQLISIVISTSPAEEVTIRSLGRGGLADAAVLAVTAAKVWPFLSLGDPFAGVQALSGERSISGLPYSGPTTPHRYE